MPISPKKSPFLSCASEYVGDGFGDLGASAQDVLECLFVEPIALGRLKRKHRGGTHRTGHHAHFTKEIALLKLRERVRGRWIRRSRGERARCPGMPLCRADSTRSAQAQAPWRNAQNRSSCPFHQRNRPS